jgi:hypothetical protein
MQLVMFWKLLKYIFTGKESNSAAIPPLLIHALQFSTTLAVDVANLHRNLAVPY